MSILIVAVVAFVAGAINAVAGGGTFLSFPALTGIGLSEKVANMTSTIGLWPGSAASVVAAGKSMTRIPRGMLLAYSIVSLIGGTIGSFLLIKTSDRSFRLVIPWLLAFATVIFAFGKPISRWAGRKHGDRSMKWSIFVGAVQLAVAIYGGYFGAGIGVLMLAGLAFAGLEDLHQTNALKVLLATLINGVSAVIFLFYTINWRIAVIMAITSTVGGFLGMLFARRIAEAKLRVFILSIGVILTVFYFLKAYRPV